MRYNIPIPSRVGFPARGHSLNARKDDKIGTSKHGWKSLLLSPMRRLSHCFHANYSIIVATRPDPTVRPPSRYQTGVLRYTNSDFLCDLCGKIRIFRCVRVVFRNFCYHGVITVFLVFLAYFFLHS